VQRQSRAHVLGCLQPSKPDVEVRTNENATGGRRTSSDAQPPHHRSRPVAVLPHSRADHSRE
jgi:hypothetical protein